jgi:uncharacterized membrane protein
MPKIEKASTLNVPVEKVFSYITNPVNQLEWLPSITDVRDVSGQGKGQRFAWTYKMMGIHLKGKTEVIEHVANQRLTFKTTGGIASTWTWTFTGEPNKTRLNLIVEYTVPVPVLGKIAERLVLRQNEREADLAMANIKERLEG